METLGTALLVFFASAIAVIFAGIGLARFGDELAEKTGWGTLWVGTLLVSIATSLPELTVNISAVWLDDAPNLAIGNVFGANMLNVFVLGVVSLIFGVANLFSNQGKDTKYLVILGISLVTVAAFMGATGDFKIGPTSLGGLILIVLYIAGMRLVYQAGRNDDPEDEETAALRGNATKAWIGFSLSALVVIVAGRYLSMSADKIAEISGISASFIGVLLVAIVTTLPESSVSVAAALRKSYGIVIGNVYGSCAFNVSIFFYSDMFYRKGPLLGTMGLEHFTAAAGAFILMSMGYLIIRGCQGKTQGWTRFLTPIIPIFYVLALYLVFVLGQQQ